MFHTSGAGYKIDSSSSDWLRESTQSWPNKFETSKIKGDLEERQVLSNLVKTKASISEWNLVEKYSSLNKLLRVTALCKRFILLLKKKAPSISKSPITTLELNEARNFWARATQKLSFNKEINLLSKISSSSRTWTATASYDSRNSDSTATANSDYYRKREEALKNMKKEKSSKEKQMRNLVVKRSKLKKKENFVSKMLFLSECI